MTTLDVRPPRTDDGDPALEMTPAEIAAAIRDVPVPVSPALARNRLAYGTMHGIGVSSLCWSEQVWIDTSEYGERMASFTTWCVLEAGIDVTADAKVRLSGIDDPLLREAVEDRFCERRCTEEDVPVWVPVDDVAMVLLDIDERAMAVFSRCHELRSLMVAVADFFGPPMPGVETDPLLWLHLYGPEGAVCGEQDVTVLNIAPGPALVTCPGCRARMVPGMEALRRHVLAAQAGGAR